MNSSLIKFLLAIFAALLISKTGLATVAHGDDLKQSWKFRVLLDDKPIGFHQVSVDSEDNATVIHTMAEFDVRFMFIPVYSYNHETRESWKDGCLVNITSTTDDNGDNYFINSISKKQELALETQDGTSSYSGCVRTFAYWDVEMLKSKRLLNTQTGEYQDVTVTDMGTGSVSLDKKEIQARHFRLLSNDMTIDLWYANDMRWLALESTTESGAVLRYVPENLASFGLDV